MGADLYYDLYLHSQDSENGGDSGCPSERRSEGDLVEHHSQVSNITWIFDLFFTVFVSSTGFWMIVGIKSKQIQNIITFK